MGDLTRVFSDQTEEYSRTTIAQSRDLPDIGNENGNRTPISVILPVYFAKGPECDFQFLNLIRILMKNLLIIMCIANTFD